MTDNKFWAVIPAAGIGQRFQASNMPKQYVSVAEQPILAWTLKPFIDSRLIDGIMVALHPDDVHFRTLDLKPDKCHTTTGGQTRAQSVYNALQALKDKIAVDDWVLVHDAARPCFYEADIQQLIEQCRDDAVGGITAIPISDTLKKSAGDYISHTIDRQDIFAAQTPQMFRYGILLKALEKAFAQSITVTDEAQAVELLKYSVKIVPGKKQNIKVTYPEDLSFAEKELAKHYGVQALCV